MDDADPEGSEIVEGGSPGERLEAVELTSARIKRPFATGPSVGGVNVDADLRRQLDIILPNDWQEQARGRYIEGDSEGDRLIQRNGTRRSLAPLDRLTPVPAADPASASLDLRDRCSVDRVTDSFHRVREVLLLPLLAEANVSQPIGEDLVYGKRSFGLAHDPSSIRVLIQNVSVPNQNAGVTCSVRSMIVTPPQMCAARLAALLIFVVTAGVVALDALPAIVLVGEGFVMVSIRGLGAVGGALWEGARPEVVNFGADAAASLLTALCRRLKIPPRTHR